MSMQPKYKDAHEPIFKVHRHPLTAIASIAAGFTSSGGCKNTSEKRWDARAWRAALQFISLPVKPADVDAKTTCDYSHGHRLRLALHYWVKWNLLADQWANYKFKVENFTIQDITRKWCSYCEDKGTCECSPLAPQVSSNLTLEGARPRKGHDPKKRIDKESLDWEDIRKVDPPMADVARALAEEYGYDVFKV